MYITISFLHLLKSSRFTIHSCNYYNYAMFSTKIKYLVTKLEPTRDFSFYRGSTVVHAPAVCRY